MASICWSILTMFYIVMVILTNAGKCNKHRMHMPKKRGLCYICLRETGGIADPCGDISKAGEWSCSEISAEVADEALRKKGKTPGKCPGEEEKINCLCSKVSEEKEGGIKVSKKRKGKKKKTLLHRHETAVKPKGKGTLTYDTIYVIAAHGWYIRDAAPFEWMYKSPIHFYTPHSCKLDDDIAVALQFRLEQSRQKAVDIVKLETRKVSQGQDVAHYVFGSNSGLEHMAGIYKIIYSREDDENVKEEILYKMYDQDENPTRAEPVKLSDFAASIEEEPGDIFWLACAAERPLPRRFTNIGALPKGDAGLQTPSKIIEERKEREKTLCTDKLDETLTEGKAILSQCITRLKGYYNMWKVENQVKPDYATLQPIKEGKFKKTKKKLRKNWKLAEEEKSMSLSEENDCMIKRWINKLLNQKALFKIIHEGGFGKAVEGWSPRTSSSAQQIEDDDYYSFYYDDDVYDNNNYLTDSDGYYSNIYYSDGYNNNNGVGYGYNAGFNKGYRKGFIDAFIKLNMKKNKN